MGKTGRVNQNSSLMPTSEGVNSIAPHRLTFFKSNLATGFPSAGYRHTEMLEATVGDSTWLRQWTAQLDSSRVVLILNAKTYREKVLPPSNVFPCISRNTQHPG